MKVGLLFCCYLLLISCGQHNQLNSEGEREGPWTLWYNDNFDLVDDSSEAWYYGDIEFDKGSPIGTATLFFKNNASAWEGELLTVDPFAPLDGTHMFTWHDGSKHLKTTWRNGLLEGIVVFWLPDGRLYSETPYVNGKRHGISVSYSESGTKMFEESYVNGELRGPHINYYSSGEKHSELTFVEGKLVGEEKYWNKKGERVDASDANLELN